MIFPGFLPAEQLARTHETKQIPNSVFFLFSLPDPTVVAIFSKGKFPYQFHCFQSTCFGAFFLCVNQFSHMSQQNNTNEASRIQSKQKKETNPSAAERKHSIIHFPISHLLLPSIFMHFGIQSYVDDPLAARPFRNKILPLSPPPPPPPPSSSSSSNSISFIILWQHRRRSLINLFFIARLRRN
jgi:hypothetical protein